jgi:hypothetical protein
LKKKYFNKKEVLTTRLCIRQQRVGNQPGNQATNDAADPGRNGAEACLSKS